MSRAWSKKRVLWQIQCVLEVDFPLRLYNRAEFMESDVAGVLRFSVKFMSVSIKITTAQAVLQGSAISLLHLKQ